MQACIVEFIGAIDATNYNINNNDSQNIKRNKLNAFVKKYWHYNNITKFSRKQFIHNYKQWAKKEGYQASQSKAE